MALYASYICCIDAIEVILSDWRDTGDGEIVALVDLYCTGAL